jgi:small subunit ribosomal protein S19e
MVSARSANQDRLVTRLAQELKLKQPEWAKFVKTGVSRERPPEDENWWNMRAGSVLRKIYMEGSVGVSKLRSFYGGKHRRGHKRAHFAKGSGKIVRTILQQLEELKLVETGKKGRQITAAGQSFVDRVAKEVFEVDEGKSKEKLMNGQAKSTIATSKERKIRTEKR